MSAAGIEYRNLQSPRRSFKVPPVSRVAAFRYESMEELEKVFNHKSMGYACSRIGNPTITAFEQRINREFRWREKGPKGRACD